MRRRGDEKLLGDLKRGKGVAFDWQLYGGCNFILVGGGGVREKGFVKIRNGK